jgi:homoserine/homoserine lactone efflux protein
MEFSVILFLKHLRKKAHKVLNMTLKKDAAKSRAPLSLVDILYTQCQAYLIERQDKLMSLDYWIIYSLTVFLASIAPGPSMLLALTHGMKYGARRTMATAMGNVTASLIQAGISIAGLNVILSASEHIFFIIKWLGAAYLIYVGINYWRSSGIVSHTTQNGHSSSQETILRMYTEAFLVAVGNPKAIIFFTALFPQFIKHQGLHLTQLFALMGTLAIIAFCCFMIYAIGGQRLIAVLSKSIVGTYFNKIVGGSFIGAGIGLAVNRNK